MTVIRGNATESMCRPMMVCTMPPLERTYTSFMFWTFGVSVSFPGTAHRKMTPVIGAASCVMFSLKCVHTDILKDTDQVFPNLKINAMLMLPYWDFKRYAFFQGSAFTVAALIPSMSVYLNNFYSNYFLLCVCLL